MLNNLHLAVWHKRNLFMFTCIAANFLHTARIGDESRLPTRAKRQVMAWPNLVGGSTLEWPSFRISFAWFGQDPIPVPICLLWVQKRVQSENIVNFLCLAQVPIASRLFGMGDALVRCILFAARCLSCICGLPHKYCSFQRVVMLSYAYFF